MSHRKTILLAALAALAVPASASAATATVNATTKTAHLTGTITSDYFGAYEAAVWFNGGTSVHGQNTCISPNCDEHTLTVGPDGAQLKLDGESDAYGLDLEIIDPDGHATEINNLDAAESTSDQHVTLDATPGNWTIRVYGSPDLYTFDYDVTATFRTPEEVANDPAPPSDDE
jgi:type 1 fimbria pilin